MPHAPLNSRVRDLPPTLAHRGRNGQLVARTDITEFGHLII
jgi:hypothetical protein